MFLKTKELMLKMLPSVLNSSHYATSEAILASSYCIAGAVVEYKKPHTLRGRETTPRWKSETFVWAYK
jgi:hypothetical protein